MRYLVPKNHEIGKMSKFLSVRIEFLVTTFDILISRKLEICAYRHMFFFLRFFIMYIFRDTSCQKALRSGRVGSGRVGSARAGSLF